MKKSLIFLLFFVIIGQSGALWAMESDNNANSTGATPPGQPSSTPPAQSQPNAFLNGMKNLTNKAKDVAKEVAQKTEGVAEKAKNATKTAVHNLEEFANSPNNPQQQQPAVLIQGQPYPQPQPVAPVQGQPPKKEKGFFEKLTSGGILGLDDPDRFADAAENVTKRMMDVVSKKAGETTKTAATGGMTGLSEALKGQEFKELTKDTANALTEASESIRGAAKTQADAFITDAKDVSDRLVDEAKDTINNAGGAIREAFDEGGEFDKGIETAVNTVVKNVDDLADGILYKNIIKLSAVILGATGVGLVLKYGVPLAFKMLERELTRPKLVMESSQKSLKEQALDIKDRFVAFFDKSKEKKKPSDESLSTAIIASPELLKRLEDQIAVTQMTREKIEEGKKGIFYRSVLLYGPPGTGKTSFAKQLAIRSGLEYAYISGSSFAKFKDGEGIEALDELMAWAKKSKKGLLIFIDEVETFAFARENMKIGSPEHKILNNFLTYIGEPSTTFIIVCATNNKNALDSAMMSRIHDFIEIPLPGKTERADMIKLYRDKYLLDETQNEADFVYSVTKHLDDQTVEKIAERTKGLSGRDLQGMINAIKTDAAICDPLEVTPELIEKVVNLSIKKSQDSNKGSWQVVD